jgi:hypothetical protein
METGLLTGPTAWSFVPSAAAPRGRTNESAVWTGTEVLIYGGSVGRGSAQGNPVAYNPVTDQRRYLPGTRYLAPSRGHTAVWTGTQMLIWGGTGGNLPFGGGAAYVPATDTWLPLPATGEPTDRLDHSAVWTGSEMLIWGGTGTFPLGDGGRYRPDATTDASCA